MLSPSERRRFRRQHISEAYEEVRSVKRAVQREATEEQAALEPGILDRTERGVFAPFKCAPGTRIGTFELVETVGRTRARLLVWRLRCDCGADVVRVGVNLVRSAREGREPTCPSCLSDRRRGLRDFARDVYRDAWRRQWVDYQTLWTPGQTRVLRQRVREDLEEEFGEIPEAAPSLRYGYLETEPTYAIPYETSIEDAWRAGGFWEGDFGGRVGVHLSARDVDAALTRHRRRQQEVVEAERERRQSIAEAEERRLTAEKKRAERDLENDRSTYRKIRAKACRVFGIKRIDFDTIATHAIPVPKTSREWIARAREIEQWLSEKRFSSGWGV